MFKRVAAVARLRKRDFKAPDKMPHAYGQKPFKLDGRLDLDITFGDKAINTPIYGKMDAKEDLLLSEGVCRQLNIVTYHPEVGPVTKITARGQSLGPGQSAGKAADTVTDTDAVTDSVTVKLVKTVCVLPSQSVMAQVQLSSALFPPGPILIEADPIMTELRGIQLSDALVFTDDQGFADVCFSNVSGMTVSVDGGSPVGSAMPADSIPLPKSETNSVEQGPEETVHSSVRQTTVVPQLSDSERKHKVQEMFSEDLDNPDLSQDQREKLLLLLEEYHDVFSLEDSERGETVSLRSTLTLVMHHRHNQFAVSLLLYAKRSLGSFSRCRRMELFSPPTVRG